MFVKFIVLFIRETLEFIVDMPLFTFYAILFRKVVLVISVLEYSRFIRLETEVLLRNYELFIIRNCLRLLYVNIPDESYA